MLLIVDPEQRPDCSQILQNPVVQKRLGMYFPDEQFEKSTEASDLLKTIIFPRNFMSLTGKLPIPNYDGDEEEKRLNQQNQSKRA